MAILKEREGKLTEDLDEILSDNQLQDNLFTTLSNSSEKTDFSLWRQGAQDFLNDNPELFGIRRE